MFDTRASTRPNEMFQGARVTPDDDVRLVNVLGAAALGLSDAMGVDAAAAAGIDATAATALVALLDLARGGSIRGLSQLIGISHSGTVRLVNRMVDDGLVARAPGRDGRTVAVDFYPARPRPRQPNSCGSWHGYRSRTRGHDDFATPTACDAVRHHDW